MNGVTRATMTATAYRMETLSEFVGCEIGVSSWVSVDQQRIDEFADCTGDRQWIHVDAERARRDSPYGGTIAHGYLTLSLAASLAIEAGAIPPDAAAALNYGLNKVRFMAPVQTGARVRNRVVLIAVEHKAGARVLLKLQNTIEIEGEARPALVAESLALLVRTSDD
jgi:acyl dehydratase